MNILPIIFRELRAEARNPVNYWLRMFGAVVLTSFLAFFLWSNASAESGPLVFRILSTVVFCAIWIVAPLLAADCISREKREGTLGLLFLTPLKSIEIILGKGAIHAVRSLTLMAAGIPILTVPFILGGITRADVLHTLLADLAALLMALAAGLLASSLSRQRARALILAEVFAFCLFMLFFKAIVVLIWGTSGRGSWSSFQEIGFVMQALFFSGRFRGLGGIFPADLLPTFLAVLSVAVAAFGAVVLFASHRLKKNWQDNPPSARQRWLQKTFCTPRFWVGLLQRRSQSSLARNPIGWLQQYSWSARLAKWGWCFVIITTLSWLLTTDVRFMQQGCSWLKNAMLLSMTFSAVGSFQREKENGALELLLVTPLREGQIIMGRLRGIWAQFLPAFATLLFTAFVVTQTFSHYNRGYNEFGFFGSIRDFVIVPVVGLYFAMRMKNFMAAWLITVALTLFLPQVLEQMTVKYLFPFGLRNSSEDAASTIALMKTMFLGSIAFLAGSSLYSRLKNRTFALAR